MHGKILAWDITGKHDVQTEWSGDKFHNYISFWDTSEDVLDLDIIYHIHIKHIVYHIKFHSPCVSSWLWQGCHWPKQTCTLDSSDGLSSSDAWWTARWRQMEWHQFLLLSAQHAGLGICDLKEHHMGHPSRSAMINIQMLYNSSHECSMTNKSFGL